MTTWNAKTTPILMVSLIALAALAVGCQWGGEVTETETFEPTEDGPQPIMPDLRLDNLHSSAGAGGGGGGGETASPINAEVLLIIDRSREMRFRADGTVAAAPEETKLHAVLSSLQIVTDEFLPRVPIGTVLFPRDPGPNDNDNERCVALEEALAGDSPNNNACQDAEVGTAPGAGPLSNDLDPFQVRMCRSTPLAKGLVAARETFSDDDVPKFAIVLTSGEDSCAPNNARLVQRAQELVEDGAKVFVVAYGVEDDFDVAALNRLTCAGETGSLARCEDGDAIDPDDGTVFIQADSPERLTAVLRIIFFAIAQMSEQA